MIEATQRALVCVNGHRQPGPDSKFCIYCGMPMAMPSKAAPRIDEPAPLSAGPVVPVDSPSPAPVAPIFQPVVRAQQYPQQAQPVQQVLCRTCGGSGQGLADRRVVCDECGWLRPLIPGYRVDTSAFAWDADGKAMAVLEGMKPLTAAAKLVSEKVGRRWIEATFNGILLGEKQLPQIYGQAVRAARILGMNYMPDVYLSGDRAWDCLTFGTNRDSFIVVGSALAGNFRGLDMLFLLGREIGHCRAGHALWKTVIRFFLGEQGPAKGFMSGGIMNAILSPTALIGGALELPLLAWARQAEITADRAGLLAVGKEEVARRVLMSWSLKSSLMFRQINIDAWLAQQTGDLDSYTKLSELTTSSTPYLGPRLKLLSEYARSQDFKQGLNVITESIRRGQSIPRPMPKADSNVLRIKCATCGTAMRIPRSALQGRSELPVKCPNRKCNAITRLKKNIKPLAAIAAKQPAQDQEENLNYVE